MPRQVRLVEGRNVPLSQIGHVLGLRRRQEVVLDRRKRRRAPPLVARSTMSPWTFPKPAWDILVDASTMSTRRADSGVRTLENCAHAAGEISKAADTGLWSDDVTAGAFSCATQVTSVFEPGRKSTRSV